MLQAQHVIKKHVINKSFSLSQKMQKQSHSKETRTLPKRWSSSTKRGNYRSNG